MDKAKVYFTDFRTTQDVSLTVKLQKLCRRAGIGEIPFEGKFTAIKMHFGELGNLAYLRPNYAKAVADLVKEMGGKPFLTDCNTLYPGSRKNALDHLYNAEVNGFNSMTTGCYVIIADGLKGTDDIAVPVPNGEFCKEAYIDTFKPMHLAVILLVIPTLALVMMADKLNRIIPDQFTIFIGVCGILSVLADVFEGSVWFSPDVKWWIPILNKVIASLVGAGFIWLIASLSLTFLGREGMGLGDVWLLLATGLVTGCYGLIVLIYVAIFAALFFAVPMLVRKIKRLNAEKKRIKNAKDPRAEKLLIQREKAKIHFAEDPDYLAFGPFLALGCAVFAVMEPFFFEKFYLTMMLFGVYF